MKNVYKVKFLCWLAMPMVGCPSIHQPSVCLSVRLPVLSCFSADCLSTDCMSPFHPPTTCLSTECPSSFRPSTVRLSTNCLPPFRSQAARLSVCLSVRLPVLSCFTADCQSPFRPPAIGLPTDCPSPFRPSTIRQSTDCLSPFHPPTTRLSVHPSVYPLLFFSTSTDCPSPFRPPAARLSPDRPSVCLSVCLPSLVFPPTVCHRFDRQLSVCPPTVRRHFDRRLSVYPPTVRRRFDRRLPVCLSVYLSVCLPSLVFPPTVNHHFDRRLSVCPSTIRHRFNARCLSIRRLPVCLSVHLPTRSCFSASCLSSFRPPAASLSVSLSSLVFSQRPLTVRHRFSHRLPVDPSVCIPPLVFLNVRRLPVYLSDRLPVLYCFSRHPPSARHRLERQHAQHHRRPGAVDWTNHTELAVC